VAGAGLALTGCIYVDPINRRPKIMPVERLCDGGDPSAPCNFDDLHHGDSVTLKAVFTDPDGQAADAVLQWRVSACDSTLTLCDEHRLYEGPKTTPDFPVRSTLEQTGGPVQRVVIDLDVFDDRGASSSESQVLTINDGPTLVVRHSARTYTIGAPIELFATYGDPDEGPPGSVPSTVQVMWTVFSPDAQPTFTLTDLDVSANPLDPAHVTVGKTLVPRAVGEWNVRVTATNSHSKTNEKQLQFTVGPDYPPCLAQWQPIVPPDSATLPVSVPTLFQVPLVDDDLDPYPQVPGQPLLGTTAFEWSILPPGAPGRQRLVGATGNTVDFDPGAFTPGEIVELRVEIFDRNHGALACADGDPVCLVSAGCNQRETWRVEIR
jgi:hypothetical protein